MNPHSTKARPPQFDAFGRALGGSKEGLIDLRSSLAKLQQTNFRISKGLIDVLLEQTGRPDDS